MTETTQRLSLITSEARAPNMEDIASNVLEVMIQDLNHNKKKISHDIEEKGRLLQEARKQRQTDFMEKLGDEILSLQDNLNKIKEQIPYLQESLRWRRLDEGVLKALGSERNVLLLEYIILMLTLGTLLIIGLETFLEFSVQTRHIMDIIDSVICVAFLWEFFWRMQFARS
jgi:hypothetical protein